MYIEVLSTYIPLFQYKFIYFLNRKIGTLLLLVVAFSMARAFAIILQCHQYHIFNPLKTNGTSINFDTAMSRWSNVYLKRLQVIITKYIKQ